jgi:hypothetical protein
MDENDWGLDAAESKSLALITAATHKSGAERLQ